MFVTADQLLAHVVGDYVLQSDWMAIRKTHRSLRGRFIALVHVVFYAVPFLFLTTDPRAFLFIVATHALIDHYRLARYVCWLKNFLSPPVTNLERDESETERFKITWWHPWKECRGTGYHETNTPWMSIWLMIIVDNAAHVACNALAIHLWP